MAKSHWTYIVVPVKLGGGVTPASGVIVGTLKLVGSWLGHATMSSARIGV